MSCKHTASTYKNKCLNIPRQKSNFHKNAHQMGVEDKFGEVVCSEDSNCSDKQTMHSFIEFYDSIPEYDDVNHLSNKDFYKKLEDLRANQRKLYECLLSDENAASWDNNKKSNCLRNSIIKSTAVDEVKPSSRRSVRIESSAPEILRYGSEGSADQTRTNIRTNQFSRKSSESPFQNTMFDEDGCTLTSRSAPCSPRKQSVVWKDKEQSEDACNTVSTFNIPIKNDDEKRNGEIHIGSNKSPSILNKNSSDKNKNANGELFRANPVPIESKIPLFNKIMHDQEKRREVVKKRSKETLKSRMRLFSFTKREEQIADLTKRLSKSSPDLFATYEANNKIPRFRAKPVPHNLFSNYAYQKMHEDQYYRSLQKKIRAEEMLKTASLPPSMAKREKQEKAKLTDGVFPQSFREMYEQQLRKQTAKNGSDFGRQLAELELDFIMSTPSPVQKTRKWSKHKNKQKCKKSASSNSTKSTSSSASSVDSINRSNLAAVLRIQSTRKRMEDEMSRRLEEARIREESRWREKVLRKRPVWQTLTYSQEEDINIRLQMRRDEEKMRSDKFRSQMQNMYGRVKQQPTLFERQSHTTFPKTREDLIELLYSTDDKLMTNEGGINS